MKRERIRYTLEVTITAPEGNPPTPGELAWSIMDGLPDEYFDFMEDDDFAIDLIRGKEIILP
jgi:hypothetical protein